MSAGRAQFGWYAAGAGAWFLSMGIQGVVVTWLAAIVLQESGRNVGFVQLASMLPSLLFLLIGGTLADRRDPRALLIKLNLMALVPVSLMLTALSANLLSYGNLLVMVAMFGILTAFIIPTRDTMLTHVTSGPIQRSATIMTMMQFGGQMVGIALAGEADRLGGWPLMIVQMALLCFGAFCISRLRPMPGAQPAADRPKALDDVVEGLKQVWQQQQIRTITLFTVAGGIFYMGTYMVGLPLLVRDVYGGEAREISWIQMAFMGGTVLGGALIIVLGPVNRPGQVMMGTMTFSAALMATVAQGFELPTTLLLITLWGMSAGMSMPLTRSIIQLGAPPQHRAKMLAIFQMTFMGAAPLGAVIMGVAADTVGILNALYIPPIAGSLVVLVAIVTGALWSMRMPEPQDELSAPDTPQA